MATIVEKSLGCVEKLVKVLLEAEKPHSRAFAGAIAGATTTSTGLLVGSYPARDAWHRSGP